MTRNDIKFELTLTNFRLQEYLMRQVYFLLFHEHTFRLIICLVDKNIDNCLFANTKTP